MGDIMENERKVYFSCDTKIDWDTYKELELIEHRKLTVRFTVFLAVQALGAAVLFLSKALDLSFCILSFVVSFFVWGLLLVIKKRTSILQGRQKVQFGKDVIDAHVEFGDKIYISSSADMDRTYDYALVEKLYETQNSVILEFNYGVKLTVEKRNIRCVDGADFIGSILNKCNCLKKDRFIKLKNREKTLKIMIGISFLISFIVLMLFFFLKTPENWRELGRNPQYSSSQQATSDNSSK